MRSYLVYLVHVLTLLVDVCCVGLAPAAAIAGTALGHHGTYKAQVRAAMLKEGHIELIKSTTILLASNARSI